MAVTHQDLIAVIDTEKMEVERTLSVGRPEGIGTAPVHLALTRDGCRLLTANSGEDAIAVFAIPQKTCDGAKQKRSTRRSARPPRTRSSSTRAGAAASTRESLQEEAAELYGEEAEEKAEAAARAAACGEACRRRSR